MDSGLAETTRGANYPSEICFLVVGDDPTCHCVVARLLRSCNYEVEHFGSAGNALKAVQDKVARLYLVLTPVFMLSMDELGLLNHVEKEFSLPIFLMSAEDKEKIVTGVLGRDPAYLYTVKSASMGNIENLWEDAFARKKGKDDAGIASTREYEAKSSSKCKTKKNRLAWTNELHHKFLEAIEHLGIARASPTRILEFMNTPGVTKHHIASHLQRHRRSLKRIQEGISFLFPEQQHSPPSGTISMPPLASARFLSSQAPICTISDCRNSTGGMKLQHEIPFPISNSSAAGNYVGFIMGSNGYEIKRNSYENTYGGTITEYVSASAGSSLHQQRQVSVTPLKHKLHCFEIDEEFDLLLDEIASSAPEFLMDGDFDDIFLN